ncbi:MAG: PAS domain S-box protein [Syntrophobacteraceae bacterium]
MRSSTEKVRGSRKSARRDLLVLAIVAFIVFIFAVSFDAFDRFARWYVKQEEPWGVEELIVIFFILSLGFAVFAYLRWRELALEVKEHEDRDGELRNVLFHKATLSNSEGQVTGLVGVITDVTDRKRSEIALRESEARWQFALEGAGDGLWDWNVQTSEVFFSRQWKAMLGFEDHEIGATLYEWDNRVHPEDKERVYADLNRHLNGHIPTYISEYRMKHKDGTYKWILDRGKVISRTGDGKPLRVIGTHSDISERKRAEESLQESEKRLRRAELAAQLGNWEFKLDTTEVKASDGARAIYSLGERNWSIPEVQKIPLPEYRSMLDKALQGLIEEGKPYDVEFKISRPTDGKILDIHSIAEYSSEKRVVFGVIQDITERKRVEKALEESEAKTRSILDNIGIGVALISPGMEILELNHRMREWFPDIEPGQHPICYRAFNQPPREAVCDYCPTYLTLQDGLVHEAATQTPQAGGIRNYRIVSSPILNAAGEVTAAIEMVDDITEKLTLESQLWQAQKMESVGRLAGGVAHDFNNMLSIILGHTEMAVGKVDRGQSLFAHLQEIRKAAERSADLTRQLLAFARKQTVTPRVLDLNETVEGMLKMLRRLIGEDIDLCWLPGAGGWQVKVDPSQIDQILANLCVNARDAIAGVGKLTIATENVAFDDTYCMENARFVPGEYLLLAVSDNGCGMDKETLERIFEPFFTTKGVGKGTGLGLATVYGIVKQNNGFINVYSEPGRGATFKIYLPRHKGKTELVQKTDPGEPAGRGHETILLVEDEPAILGMTRVMLERQGYTVLSASTPGEAIRLAVEYPGEIHLLMTDVVMPEMNGRDLAKNLLSYYPNLKRLFMSGYTADVIAHHGVLDAGVNFIQKPFSMKNLAAKLREALREND